MFSLCIYIITDFVLGSKCILHPLRIFIIIIIIYRTYWYLFMGVEMPYVILDNQLGWELFIIIIIIFVKKIP